MQWLDKIPFPPLIVAAALLGLAPFVPEPHLLEKLRLLSQWQLSRPIDMFDLLLHAAPVVVLMLKVGLGMKGITRTKVS